MTCRVIGVPGIRRTSVAVRPHNAPPSTSATTTCTWIDEWPPFHVSGDAHVAQAIAAEGVTWTRAVTLYQGQELFSQGFVDRGRSPFPPFVNIGQNRTEELLDEKIHGNPLITEKWGHTVEAVERKSEQSLRALLHFRQTGQFLWPVPEE